MAYEIPPRYLDESNQIITNEFDLGNRQGDSLQRAGFVHLAYYLLYITARLSISEYQSKQKEYVNRLDNLAGWYPGVYRRGSDKTVWSGSELTMSRDQVLSNIVALGLVDKKVRGKRLLHILLSNLSRLMLFTINIYPNRPSKWWQIKLPDITGFMIWAIYIRAFETSLLKPFLYLFDLSLLANSALITHHLAKDPNFSDELSFQAALIQSQLVMPTWISRLAVRIYNKRPMPGPPHLGYKTTYAPLAALNQYFDYNELSAPIDDFLAPTLQTVLKND